MQNLPPKIILLLRHFECVFSERVWEWAVLLSDIVDNSDLPVQSGLRLFFYGSGGHDCPQVAPVALFRLLATSARSQG